MAERKIYVDVELNDADAKKKLEGLDDAADQTGRSMGDRLAKGAQQAEYGIQQVAVQSTKSIGIFGQMRQSLNAMAEAEGLTFKNMGLLGSATGAAASAMAGWAIGRTIAELTGLDAVVQKGWQSLLGFADAAEQSAAAKADVLAKASANAGRAITDLTEAIKINAKAFEQEQLARTDWRKTLADAQREVRGLSDATIEEIEIAKRAGATTEEITAKFGLSALAQKELAIQTQATTEALKAQEEATRALDEAYVKLMSDVKNANQLALMEEEAAAMAQKLEQEKLFADEEIKVRLRKQEAYDKEQAAAAAAEEARIAANQAEIDALTATAQAQQQAGEAAATATDTAIEGYRGVAAQVQITGDAIKEWIKLMQYSAEVNAILGGGSSLFTTQSQRERIAQIGGGFGGGGGPLPVFDRGGVVDRPTIAMLAKNGKREFVIPEARLPEFAGGGGGRTIIIPVSVGTVDSEARVEQLVRRVSLEVSTATNAERRPTMSRS